MCIRDRDFHANPSQDIPPDRRLQRSDRQARHVADSCHHPCLLYTSDAADERSSVDLGGRSIIKKKKVYIDDVCYTSKYTTYTYSHVN